jgi:hypothetical protein
MQVNQGDSRLLMVGNQIDILIPGPAFGHNLSLSIQMGYASLIKKSSFKSFSMV